MRSDEQKVAHFVAQALAADDPGVALRPVLAPGVEWHLDEDMEIAEIAAGQFGVALVLRRADSTAPTNAVDKWQVLQVDGGKVVAVVETTDRKEAAGLIGRVA